MNGSTNVTIPMSALLGDVNGNGAVNASDVALTKSRSGQPIDATNFRLDVNADGSINGADVSRVKSVAGTGCPEFGGRRHVASVYPSNTGGGGARPSHYCQGTEWMGSNLKGVLPKARLSGKRFDSLGKI